MVVTKFLLVWNSELSLAGALEYVAQRIRGSEECALCELTYDGVVERKRWKECKRDLGVPFEGVHKNRLGTEQAAASGGDFPCVLAETPSGLVKVLGRAEIEVLANDLDRFADRLREVMSRA